jgi:hypothetical protein
MIDTGTWRLTATLALTAAHASAWVLTGAAFACAVTESAFAISSDVPNIRNGLSSIIRRNYRIWFMTATGRLQTGRFSLRNSGVGPERTTASDQQN